MTAHTILSLFILICTNHIIYQQNKWFTKWFPLYSRIIALLAMLPYLIGGMVVIAHFTFEGTADNLTRYGIIYTILLISLWYQLYNGYHQNKYLSIVIILIWIILVIWWYFWTTLHHYEWDHSFYPYWWWRPTPELWEQTRSIIQWISNIILILLYCIYWYIYSILRRK